MEAKSPLSLNRSLFSQSAIGIGDASRADDRLSLPQGSRSPTRMLSHPYARPNTLSLAGSLMKGWFFLFLGVHDVQFPLSVVMILDGFVYDVPFN